VRAARGMAEELCHLPDELLPKGLRARASLWHQLLLSRLPLIGPARRELKGLMAKAWRERLPRPAQPAGSARHRQPVARQKRANQGPREAHERGEP